MYVCMCIIHSIHQRELRSLLITKLTHIGTICADGMLSSLRPRSLSILLEVFSKCGLYISNVGSLKCLLCGLGNGLTWAVFQQQGVTRSIRPRSIKKNLTEIVLRDQGAKFWSQPVKSVRTLCNWPIWWPITCSGFCDGFPMGLAWPWLCNETASNANRKAEVTGQLKEPRVLASYSSCPRASQGNHSTRYIVAPIAEEALVAQPLILINVRKLVTNMSSSIVCINRLDQEAAKRLRMFNQVYINQRTMRTWIKLGSNWSNTQSLRIAVELLPCHWPSSCLSEA